MQLKRFEEQIFFATARVVSIGSDKKASIGTAFLVRERVTDDREVVLAISNKHVLVDRQRSMSLVFAQADVTQEEKRPLLGQTITLEGQPPEISYFEHPTADLACLNVSPIDKAGAYYRTLDTREVSATFEEEDLLPNREVCFVGYPDGRYDTKNNLPILRSGKIATIPKVDHEGEKQFLIDAQVYQGSSGSPVFLAPPPFGGTWKFLGVLTDVLAKHDKLTKVPVNFERFGIQRPIGLGCVLKPVLVSELVAIAVARVKADLEERAKRQPQAPTPEQTAAAPA